MQNPLIPETIINTEKYIIDIDQYGKFNREGIDIFFALELIKTELLIGKTDEEVINFQMKINSAFIINRNDFLIDITSALNP